MMLFLAAAYCFFRKSSCFSVEAKLLCDHNTSCHQRSLLNLSTKKTYNNGIRAATPHKISIQSKTAKPHKVNKQGRISHKKQYVTLATQACCVSGGCFMVKYKQLICAIRQKGMAASAILVEASTTRSSTLKLSPASPVIYTGTVVPGAHEERYRIQLGQLPRRTSATCAKLMMVMEHMRLHYKCERW